jgi:hypothetical protein
MDQKETKDQIPLGIFVFSIVLNTVFATLSLVKVSLDAWGIGQIAAVRGNEDRAGKLWYFLSEYYVELSSPSVLTMLVLLICLICILLLPFMIYEAVNSFRKKAPLARNIADVIAAFMLPSILAVAFFVVAPAEAEIGAECAEVSGDGFEKCNRLTVKLWTVHISLLCMQLVMPINDVVKFSANKGFDAFSVSQPDCALDCDISPKSFGKGVATDEKDLHNLLEQRNGKIHKGDKIVKGCNI